MCALPWNVAHCQQRAMAASRKNNRNIGWKNQHGDGEIKKNTSRPYHCTFQCWCNNYAKANNIWQTFKNARSQNIYTDSPHFPNQVQNLPKKKKLQPFDQLKLMQRSVFLLQMFLIICNIATN